jgi:two-component system response regulator HydG
LPVLIEGETGTGKELFARALHDLGKRKGAPWVAVNCGAIADSLFEAEMFGHARGSFTGAERARAGLIARANGGTLFLDEVGELPIAKQATLLRALESRCFRPVGADEERAFDVRVVAATNRDLELAAAQGSFRRDLLYRINVVHIAVPPLRSHPEDIAALASAFARRGGASLEIGAGAMDALTAYSWPGNVRELEHLVQRWIAMGLRRLDVRHLPRAVRSGATETRERAASERRPAPGDEKQQVLQALDDAGGNITRAADRLGLTRQGLKKKMARLGVRRPAPSRPTRRGDV